MTNGVYRITTTIYGGNYIDCDSKVGKSFGNSTLSSIHIFLPRTSNDEVFSIALYLVLNSLFPFTVFQKFPIQASLHVEYTVRLHVKTPCCTLNVYIGKTSKCRNMG